MRPDEGAGPWLVRPGGPRSAEMEEAIEILRPARVREPSDAEGWDALGKEIRDSRPDWIVAAGGDGTVQGVVRLLDLEGGSVLSVLPDGTGNDFARALGLPLDLVEAARALEVGGVDRSVDLLEVRLDDEEPRLVVNAVTAGLSEMVHEVLTDEMKATWGRFAYLRAALAGSSDLTPFQAALTTSGGEGSHGGEGVDREWRGKLLHISIANGPTAGGGMPIAPGAEIADGQLDLCAIEEGGWAEIGTGIPVVLSGSEPDEGPWMRSRVEQLQLELTEPHDISVDGEVTQATRIRARILPGVLTVRVPASSG